MSERGDFLSRLKEGNLRFSRQLARRPNANKSRQRELAESQKPFAAILGCADSRVPPELIFDQGLGDLFVVRNAGNIPDDSSLASLEYAVGTLEVSLIVVLGHSSCGAVTATVEKIEASERFNALCRHIEVGLNGEESGKDPVQDAVEQNALHTAQVIRSTGPVLKKAVLRGELKVVSAWYDLKSAEVHWLED